MSGRAIRVVQRLSVPFALNTAWMLSCRGEARAFARSTGQVALAQADVLRSIVAQNRESRFGADHDFAAIGDVEAFRRAVPLSTYEDYADPVQRIAAGESRVLTREPVRLLEPTSGTTKGEKLIPYTGSLQREFQRAIAVWIDDLFTRRPAVRAGRAYWSISPALGPPRTTPSGIPIGFDDDTAYLSRWQRAAMRYLLAAPPEVARLPYIDDFRYATLLALLRAHDLALVSVWSPTFLTSLLQGADAWRGRLVEELRRNGRAGQRSARLLSSGRSVSELTSELWPRLAVVSSWADGTAGRFLPELRAIVPQAEIQPKGLVATEAFVSIPLVDRPGAALAIRSHFFEFRPTEDDGSTRLAHELQPGGRYAVIVTTGGGLYRYELGDVVEVVGFEGQCPLVRFVGRAGVTSDLVGEKLIEAFVSRALDAAIEPLGVRPRFAMFAPTASPPPRYRLYLEATTAPESPDVARLANLVEEQLCANPHYRYAVALGQLAPLEVVLLNAPSDAWQLCERKLSGAGQKLGDIKPPLLGRDSTWDDALSRLPVQARSRAGEGSTG